MPKVIGTHGNVINVQLLGVAEVMRRLRAAGKEVENSADLGVIKAATYVEEEVKESISGHRAEPRSVDTGHFVGDVKAEKVRKSVAKVHAPDTPYADILEFGGTNRQPRRHFRNTKDRTAKDVKNIIQGEIRLG